jgi:hypothetical protein
MKDASHSGVIHLNGTVRCSCGSEFRDEAEWADHHMNARAEKQERNRRMFGGERP